MKIAPVGIKPRFFFIRDRLWEIYDASERFRETGEEIPKEWDEEYDKLHLEYMEFLNKEKAPST